MRFHGTHPNKSGFVSRDEKRFHFLLKQAELHVKETMIENQINYSTTYEAEQYTEPGNLFFDDRLCDDSTRHDFIESGKGNL